MPDLPPQPSVGDVSSIPWRVGQLETTVINHGNRLDAVEDRFLKLDGAFALLKFTLGTSIVTGALAIISIAALLSGAAR